MTHSYIGLWVNFPNNDTISSNPISSYRAALIGLALNLKALEPPQYW